MCCQAVSQQCDTPADTPRDTPSDTPRDTPSDTPSRLVGSMTEAQAVLVLRDGLAGPSWTFDAMCALRNDYGWPPNAVAAIRGQFP